MSSGIVKKNTSLGIILAIMTALFLGAYPASVRGAYADGANVTFILLAMVFARAFFLSSFCVLTSKKLFQTKKETAFSALGAILQAVSFIGIFGALSLIEAPIVLTIVFLYPVMLLFYMIVRREVKLDFLILSTTALALIGVSFVVQFWGDQAEANVTGLALALLAAVTTTARMYIFGKQTSSRNPAVVGSEAYILTFVFLLPMLLWELPMLPQSPDGWSYTALAAVAQVISAFGLFYTIALLGAFSTSLFLKFEPVCTAFFAVLLLGEVLAPSQYVGIAIVIGSLIAYQVLSHRKEKRLAELKASVEGT